MKPIAIFDKSFLQALNPDEAAIFDMLFATNITPIFFTETMADLEKEVKKGRTPEEIVGNLAYKTPVMHSYPPLEGDFLVSKLYDQTYRGWRRSAANPLPTDAETTKKILGEVSNLTELAGQQEQSQVPFVQPLGVESADAVVIERRIPLKWGKWQFMPSHVKADT